MADQETEGKENGLFSLPSVFFKSGRFDQTVFFLYLHLRFAGGS
jgi:hypothetical protein